MNYLLYNISIVMVLVGIILLTHYLTKTYNNNNIQNSDDLNNQIPDNTKLDNIYDERPSAIFKNMFNQPSIWQGYQIIDTKELPLGAKMLS